MKEIYLTSEAERKYRKSYYERNRERILQKRKERYVANLEREREKNKQYSMTHDRNEYFREYHKRKKAVI